MFVVQFAGCGADESLATIIMIRLASPSSCASASCTLELGPTGISLESAWNQLASIHYSDELILLPKDLCDTQNSEWLKPTPKIWYFPETNENMLVVSHGVL